MKLLVLDKDWTLIRPKSGNTFVQHPEDQELIEGVAEAITRYIADGWALAIASNQGGCEVRECKAIDFPVGAYYINGNDKPLMVIRKNRVRELVPDSNEVEPFVMMHTAEPRPNGKDYLYFPAESIIQFQYKTIGMAIAEMRYAMQLTGITYSVLCPDMDGQEAYIVRPEDSPFGVQRMTSVCDECFGFNFRKPNSGMLQLAKISFRGHFNLKRGLMIGDREEDQGAAQAAGFDFMWAHKWRGES